MVFLKGRRVTLSPQSVVGKGGEADVFDLGNGQALKLFKSPDHPDYAGSNSDQDLARNRLLIHQEKLRNFPARLPERVVAPIDLATDQTGTQIVGYSMRLLTDSDVLARLADPVFRRAGISGNRVGAIFRDLLNSVAALHRAKVIIGDFNDLNVLVRDEQAWLIDSDSFQFGKFPCRVFTFRFLDPLLQSNVNGLPALKGLFSTASDWYAFTVMLMECLLGVHPFGGVFRPADPAKRIPADLRPLHRITVFNSEVRYPNAALPWMTLPDELLQQFHLIFEKDDRNPFPEHLLTGMRWRNCSVCGMEHARSVCPQCQHATAGPGPLMVVRNRITARRLLRTTGRILAVPANGSGKCWVVYENGAYRREDGLAVISGPLDPALRFQTKGNTTFVGRGSSLAAISTSHAEPIRSSVDLCEGVPQFAANSRHLFWLQGGQLFREGAAAPELWGEVLQGQTRFWVGEEFGFGFYRAGHLHVAFVFPTRGRGLNDGVKVPPIPGQLVGTACYLSDRQAWFFAQSRDRGRTIAQCLVVRPDGTVIAQVQEPTPDSGWLHSLGGKSAAGSALFAATDRGVIRLEIQSGVVTETRRFADTESMVKEGSSILVAPDGLYTTDGQELWHLKIDSSP